LRLQGLATLVTLSSLRTPVSFVSHSQRSWDSPFEAFGRSRGIDVFPRQRAHLPFRLRVIQKSKTLRTASQAAASGLLPSPRAPTNTAPKCNLAA
jgi:hypothetical protein